jgi:hypothetical protein
MYSTVCFKSTNSKLLLTYVDVLPAPTSASAEEVEESVEQKRGPETETMYSTACCKSTNSKPYSCDVCWRSSSSNSRISGGSRGVRRTETRSWDRKALLNVQNCMLWIKNSKLLLRRMLTFFQLQPRSGGITATIYRLKKRATPISPLWLEKA